MLRARYCFSTQYLHDEEAALSIIGDSHRPLGIGLGQQHLRGNGLPRLQRDHGPKALRTPSLHGQIHTVRYGTVWMMGVNSATMVESVSNNTAVSKQYRDHFV